MRQRLLTVLRSAFLRVCPAGCYKHFVHGKWVCCRCGDGA
jgi:hypothetical protein